MAELKTKYGTEVALTITLASLASSTTMTAGRSSAAVANGTTRATDYLVGGKITVGTTPTANRRIGVWVYANHEDTPTYPDVIDGTDAADDFSTEARRNSAVKLAATIVNPGTTSDVTFFVAPFSVAALFGWVCPENWGLFIAHETGVALNATGSNHGFWARPITLEEV